MDDVIRRRMVMDIQVWKCESITDGDKNFNPVATILKGYSAAQDGVVVTSAGVEVKTKTVVYLPGTEIDKFTEDDEITVPYGRRLPIQSINPYPSLEGGWEIVVIRL